MKRFLFVMTLPVLLGGNDAPRCPEDMVLVPGSRVCIDRYEWPNKKGERPAVAMTATASPFDTKKGVVMDAERLCASVGKRVCERSEWISACQGPKGADFPFGRTLPKKPKAQDAKCNYAQFFIVPDETKVFSRDPKELERLNQSDPSGTRGCVSASGAEDMMGNVEEWVRCPSNLSKTGWCLAGRFWSDAVPCSKMTGSHVPEWHYYETGFRCCKDAD